jgi:hypothetical protein
VWSGGDRRRTKTCFESCELLELRCAEAGPQGLDRDEQSFGLAAALGGVFRKARRERKSLGRRWAGFGSHWRRRGRNRHREQGIREITPGIELSGADADLGLYLRKRPRQRRAHTTVRSLVRWHGQMWCRRRRILRDA